MIHLTIDHISLSVPEGSSVLEAARTAGMDIPSMCYKEGHDNHPSCMVCMVRDRKTGNLFPSCSIKVTEGMDLISNDEQVKEARRDALELLLSDHVGDCEAPCSLACPAGMNIPLMNRLIAANRFDESLKVVKEEIALPYILGFICPAPCEKACRRRQIDDSVSICLLKRFVAAEDEKSGQWLPPVEVSTGKKVAILGSGPAGLAAAYYLLQKGHGCVVYDKNAEAGGALRYSVPAEKLTRAALDAEIHRIERYGARFILGTAVSRELFASEISKGYDAVILATGDTAVEGELLSLFSSSKSGISVTEGTYETSEAGVFACGSVLRAQKMAVRAVAQGKAAALAADQYLRGMKPIPERKKFNSRFDKLSEPEFAEYLREASGEKQIAPGGGEMAGFTPEEAIREAARCMHCDCRKLDECKLRNYADAYHADRKKYATGERKLMTRHTDHPEVVYEPEKCIRCGLCIDITVKNNEYTGLTFIGRGFDVRIEVPFGKPMSAALVKSVKECVESCPTGALSFKYKT